MNSHIRNTIDPETLGFDFDGVIADTAETFLRLACEEYGHCDIRLEDITHFQVEECLDMDAGIIETIFMDILKDSLGTGLKPMEGALEVLGEMTRQACVTLITARSELQPVMDWLEEMMPSETFRNIHVVAMGSHDNKLHHINDLGLSHFIDDRLETCLQLHAAGIMPFVFNQPWNQSSHILPTVHNWEDIRRLCLGTP